MILTIVVSTVSAVHLKHIKETYMGSMTNLSFLPPVYFPGSTVYEELMHAETHVSATAALLTAVAKSSNRPVVLHSSVLESSDHCDIVQNAIQKIETEFHAPGFIFTSDIYAYTQEARKKFPRRWWSKL